MHVPARQVYSDDDILRALRLAAQRCGEPLSHGQYDRVSHAVGGPSSTRIIQRYGGWRKACEAAGVTAGRPHRDYAHAWDQVTVTAAVADYLASEGATGTYSDYVEWAKAQDRRPSGATVRNTMGGWGAAKARASGRLSP